MLFFPVLFALLCVINSHWSNVCQIASLACQQIPGIYISATPALKLQVCSTITCFYFYGCYYNIVCAITNAEIKCKPLKDTHYSDFSSGTKWPLIEPASTAAVLDLGPQDYSAGDPCWRKQVRVLCNHQDLSLDPQTQTLGGCCSCKPLPSSRMGMGDRDRKDGF